MRLISTRGAATPTDFRGALMTGLASDGGLYTPEAWPLLPRSMIARAAGRSYTEFATEMLGVLTGHAYPPHDLSGMVERAYAPFRHAAICPVVQIDANLFVLELFHGPTLAFKDFAMRLLAELLSHELQACGQTATIVCATSGDTGSAAIDAFAGKAGVALIALYPHGRVSDVQRRQMTTVQADNVQAVAIDGTFDDCQAIVKTMFADEIFRSEVRLTAVNSINWARIAAQAVYYVAAAAALGSPHRELAFAVPTGNFGDIFAGYVAKRMGLPIARLMIATNANDILVRALRDGEHALGDVRATTSPSMDIQVSSNFERLMFHAGGCDPDAVRAAFGALKQQGRFTLPAGMLEIIRRDFSAEAANDEEIAREINTTWRRSGYLLDPHTATATHAARRRLAAEPGVPVIALATASPAKFPDAVHAACGVNPALPAHLSDLMTRDECSVRLPNDVDAVMGHVRRTRGV